MYVNYTPIPSSISELTVTCNEPLHTYLIKTIKKYIFINRVINVWNSLPDNIVAASSIYRVLNETLTVFIFLSFGCVRNFSNCRRLIIIIADVSWP